ncbi:hypothetical protein IR010_18975 [Flavobacterium sp. MR2016-29]|uniref:STM3941 family protein n=1 Tax=Flavobacterium sp. MR2016-29 TaxID=2783795 RepID=UPI00188D2293|nr:STM3941 family protein [Flavobacterium sp. MR2016-29]MBF4494630.1 hypothetical protein [Flavobacterium sp. MR2016-29]
MNKIEIPLSKTKIFFLLLGALVFVMLGTLFVINPEKFISPIMRSTEFIRISGIASILLFGLAGIYGIIKLFDNRIGLTVDENGITDNTNASSVGLINWIDITEIKTEQIMSTKFLLIFTNNTEKYLDRVGSIRRKLMLANEKMYGTPLSITSNTLKYDFDDLERLLKNCLNEQLEKKPNR